jgi:hypothetical protein
MSHSTHSHAGSSVIQWPATAPDPIVQLLSKAGSFARRWKSVVLTTLFNVLRAALFVVVFFWPWQTAQ